MKASGGVTWDNYTLQNVVVPLNSGAPAIDHIVLTLGEHPSFPQSDDHWHVDGVNIMTWSANGAEAA